jgi:phosphoserine phosphatase
MTRPPTRDLRARSVLAGEASAAAAELAAALETRVWLVTAAPVEVARLLARRPGLTGALGTVAAQRDGVYTGELVGDILHGPAKVEAVRSPASHEGLDLASCAAYSDSVNDLRLLDLVGHPCAVNPDGRLRRHAEAAGRRIRDYRIGRKVARLGLLTAGASGITLGAVSAAMAIRKRVS